MSHILGKYIYQLQPTVPTTLHYRSTMIQVAISRGISQQPTPLNVSRMASHLDIPSMTKLRFQNMQIRPCRPKGES